ncbi:ParB family protein [Streptomyces sp. NPDC001205]
MSEPNEPDASAGHGRRARKARREPAGIVPRTEPDPVDVVLGDMAATPAGRRDTDDHGGDSVAARRHDVGDTTTSSGDMTSATPASRRQRDTRGDSDTATRRQETATAADVATSGSDASLSGDTTSRGDTREEDDMTATATSPPPPGSGAPAAGPVEEEAVRSTSFSIPPSLTARLRAAQWHTQTKPDGHHNVSELVRRMILVEVRRLEDRYNEGQPFPEVGRLRTGPSPEGAVRGAEIRARNRATAAAREQAAPPRQRSRKKGAERRQEQKNPASEGREAEGS